MYYHPEFRNRLSDIANSSPSIIKNCPHCSIPKEQRALLTDSILEDHQFAFDWWSILFLGEELRRYFPDNYKSWMLNTGGYPIPVELFGFGCAREISVIEFDEMISLKGLNINSKMNFMKAFVLEFNKNFEFFSHIHPKNFVEAIKYDIEAKDFLRTFKKLGSIENNVSSELYILEDINPNHQFFKRAVKLVYENRHEGVSPHLLRECLGINLNFASKILDLMESKGLVISDNHKSTRKVLFDIEKYLGSLDK